MHLLIGRHPRRWIFLLLSTLDRRPSTLEMLDESLKRIGPPIEHEIVCKRPLVRRDLDVRLNVRRIDDRHVEPCFHAVMQEHRVEHRTRFERQTEADVRDAKAGEDAGQLAFDEADAFDRLDG